MLTAAATLIGAQLLFKIAFLDEERVRIRLHCDNGGCTAELNGQHSITLPRRGALPGDRIGLYSYNRGERQYFTRFRFRPYEAAAEVVDFRFPRAKKAQEKLSIDHAWCADPSTGVYYGGPRWKRSVAFIHGARSSAFDLDVEIENPTDAGIMFHAADERNGIIFAVRPLFNDAIFFRLADGEPGPVLAIMPYQSLRTGREALRVLQLIVNILLRTAVLLLALHLLTAWPRSFRLPSWLSAQDLFERRRSLVTLSVILFLSSWALVGLASIYGLHRIPHIGDETAYLFQARIFADGHFWAETPALPEFFDMEHVIMSDGRWYSKYPPMTSFLLSLGLRAGAYWLVNPFLSAVLSLFVFYLVREMAPVRVALLAWLLLVTSSFYIMLGASLMSHTPTATFLTGSLLFAVRAQRRWNRMPFFLSGIMLGMALLTRPYTAFLYAIPLGIVFLFQLRLAPSPLLLGKRLLVFLAGVYPFLVVYFPWNIMHAPFDGIPVALYAQYNDTDLLGFGPMKGYGWYMTWGSWGHTPAKAFRSVHRFLDFLSRDMFGWPWQWSLVFVPVPLLDRRYRRWGMLGLLFIGVVIAGHMLYWCTQHIGYGPRYWYAIAPLIAVLTALGIHTLYTRSQKTAPKGSVSLATVALCTLLAVFAGRNAVRHVPASISQGYNYNNVSPALRDHVRNSGLTNAIVFASSSGCTHKEGLFLNDPFFETGNIYARDLGPANEALIRQYPEKAVYRWDGVTLEPY